MQYSPKKNESLSKRQQSSYEYDSEYESEQKKSQQT